MDVTVEEEKEKRIHSPSTPLSTNNKSRINPLSIEGSMRLKEGLGAIFSLILCVEEGIGEGTEGRWMVEEEEGRVGKNEGGVENEAFVSSGVWRFCIKDGDESRDIIEGI